MEDFLKDCKIIVCSPDAAAAQTDLDGAVIDMAQDEGYEGVAFIAHLGDVADTCVLELQAKASAAADGSDPATDGTTGTTAAGASNCDDKLLVLQILRPSQRYVFPRLKRGTANAAVNSMIAALFKGRRCPVVQSTDHVIDSAAAVVR